MQKKNRPFLDGILPAKMGIFPLLCEPTGQNHQKNPPVNGT